MQDLTPVTSRPDPSDLTFDLSNPTAATKHQRQDLIVVCPLIMKDNGPRKLIVVCPLIRVTGAIQATTHRSKGRDEILQANGAGKKGVVRSTGIAAVARF
jgi:hypothetical protein